MNNPLSYAGPLVTRRRWPGFDPVVGRSTDWGCTIALGVGGFLITAALGLPWGVPLGFLGASAIVSAFHPTTPRAAGRWTTNRAVSLFVVVYVMTILLSRDPGTSMRMSSAFPPAILLYALVSGHCRQSRCIRVLLWSLTWTGLTLSALILWTAALAPWMTPFGWAKHAATQWIVVPNDVALVAAVAPLTCAILLNCRRTLMRICACSCLVLMITAPTVVRSRVSLLALAASLGSFLAMKRPRVTALAFASLGLLVASIDSANGFALTHKLFHSGADEGVSGRLLLWGDAWKSFTGSPWFGQGPHTFVSNSVRWAHSLYLEAAAEQGLAGFVALVLLLERGLSTAWTAATVNGGELSDYAAGVFASLIGFCVAAAFESSFQREWVVTTLFLLVGLASLCTAKTNPRWPGGVPGFASEGADQA